MANISLHLAAFILIGNCFSKESLTRCSSSSTTIDGEQKELGNKKFTKFTKFTKLIAASGLDILQSDETYDWASWSWDDIRDILEGVAKEEVLDEYGESSWMDSDPSMMSVSIEDDIFSELL